MQNIMNNNWGWHALFSSRNVLLSFAIIYFLNSLFISTFRDQDLESFLYLGSMLDSGELIYFFDFESKLPFVQYLFWAPYRLGGIGAWRLMTFAIVVALSVLSSILIVAGIAEDRGDRGRLVVFASAVSLISIYSLHGASVAHINIAAAMLMYLALGLCLSGIQGRNESLRNGFSAVAAAFAVSIRQHYLFVLPALAACAIFAPRIASGRYASAVTQALLFTIVVSLMLVVQFVPYLFYADGLSTLFSALSAMQTFPLATAPAKLLHEKFRADFLDAAFYLLLYLGLVVLLYTLRRRSRAGQPFPKVTFFGSVTCLAAAILLDTSFLSAHYWNHYITMFVPFTNIIIIYSYVLFRTTENPSFYSLISQRKGELVVFAAIVFFLFKAAESSIYRARDFSKLTSASLAINDRDYDHRLLEILRQVRDDGFSFYVQDAPIYHRLLQHRRIGDGHPFMLFWILRGNRIGPVGDLLLYSDRVHENPCLALWESGKDIIVLSHTKKDPQVLRCLTSSDSNYVELSPGTADAAGAYSWFEDSASYRVFVRRTSP